MGAYKLDINDRFEATLESEAFQGATKRNKPNLELGDLVYCKVDKSTSYMQPVAVCTSIRNTKAWHTGQATFGALKKGVVYDCEIEMCQKMLSRAGKDFLKQLGKKVSFELIVGYNGRIWINAEEPKEMVFIFNVMKVYNDNPSEAEELIASLK